MDKLVYQYIKCYEPNAEVDDLSNLKKQLVILLNKLHDNKSVYKNLPFDYMPVGEQLKLMHHLRTSPVAGRQIISNMTKIDADRSFLEFACPSLNNVFSSDSELREIRENLLSLDQWVLNTRFQIRSTEDSRFLLLNLMRTNSNILRCYQDEDYTLLMMGVGLAGFERLRSYIDYVANALLQFLVYHIVVNKKEKALAIISQLCIKADDLDKVMDKKLEQQHQKWKINPIKLTAELVSGGFSDFLTHRSRFEEEIHIKQLLVEEMKNRPDFFGEIPSKYISSKRLIQPTELQTIESIITEGKHVNNYGRKLLNTQKFIDVFSSYGGRSCNSLCLMDLKVYFREIYLSHVCYARKQATSIVSEYLADVSACSPTFSPDSFPQFRLKKQYIFLREKINRGYFRETGLSKAYVSKFSFEEKLYTLLLKPYLFYSLSDGVNAVYEIYSEFLQEYYDLLAE